MLKGKFRMPLIFGRGNCNVDKWHIHPAVIFPLSGLLIGQIVENS